MQAVKLVIPGAVVVTIALAGCSAADQGPPPGVSRVSALPPITAGPEQPSIAATVSKPTPTIPAASSYTCRDATATERLRASNNYSGDIIDYKAIDLGDGWSLVAFQPKGNPPLVELTNGTRMIHAPKSGIWPDYPIAFASPQRAIDAALACLT